MGLFQILSEKLTSQCDNTIPAILQTNRQQNEYAEEWMAHLRMKENECDYKEKERSLKEQLINDITIMR